MYARAERLHAAGRRAAGGEARCGGSPSRSCNFFYNSFSFEFFDATIFYSSLFFVLDAKKISSELFCFECKNVLVNFFLSLFLNLFFSSIFLGFSISALEFFFKKNLYQKMTKNTKKGKKENGRKSTRRIKTHGRPEISIPRIL